MENVLTLTTEEQNNLDAAVYAKIDAIKWDNRIYAEESGENMIEYLLRDYDAHPEGWNSIFEFSYDEVSSKAKSERRAIIERLLNF